MYHIFFMHSSIDGRLGSFHVLAILHSAYLPLFLCDLASVFTFQSFAGGSDGKIACCQCWRPKFNPWVGRIPWRRKWQTTPVPLSGKFHERRKLIGYSPWGGKESDTTKWLCFHFHFQYLYICPLVFTVRFPLAQEFCNESKSYFCFQ